MMDSTIGERLNKSRKYLRLSQLDISESIGVFPGAISKMENGQQQMKSQQLETYCKSFGVNPTWLIMGYGPMLLKDLPEDLNDSEENIPLIKLDISGLIRKIRDMDKKMEMMDGELKVLKGKMG
ncbi:MAG: helix-turn-helix domain-containing protein [Chlorobi bacterium]|nr:helix-turn-helix domain-containing protein [Chlorobiota bacterium]